MWPVGKNQKCIRIYLSWSSYLSASEFNLCSLKIGKTKVYKSLSGDGPETLERTFCQRSSNCVFWSGMSSMDHLDGSGLCFFSVTYSNWHICCSSWICLRVLVSSLDALCAVWRCVCDSPANAESAEPRVSCVCSRDKFNDDTG